MVPLCQVWVTFRILTWAKIWVVSLFNNVHMLEMNGIQQESREPSLGQHTKDKQLRSIHWTGVHGSVPCKLHRLFSIMGNSAHSVKYYVLRLHTCQ